MALIEAKVEVVKGINWLVVRVPMEAAPRPSGSGKTLTIATTGGLVQTGLEHNGKPVKLNLTASVPIE